MEIAERRMFAKSIVVSDDFLDMPATARCLYFTLGMFADDDGFVNNPKSIMRQSGSTTDDMNILIAKKYVISFESGVIVIRHWRIHNYIKSDRYHGTVCIDEKKQLSFSGDGKVYEKTVEIPTMVPECVQDGSKMDTEVSIGKNSLGKDSIDDSLQSNDDVTDNETTSHNEEIKEIVAYLNERTGSKYRASTEATKRHINARFNEGFTVDDFKIVIDIKTNEWLGDAKMKKFLRPQTLFGTNFESYLNQQTPSKKEKVEESAADDEEYKAFMERFKGRYE